jgi:hypothetical protein
MATLTVEGVPDGLLARLRVAAAGNGRCLNSEVIVHLARSAGFPGDRHPGVAAFGAGCRAARAGCRCATHAGRPAPVGWGGPAGCATEAPNAR